MKTIRFPQIMLIFVVLVGTLVLPSKAQDNPQDYVSAHNQARSLVGVGPIQWDERIASVARAYADRLRGNNCNLVHSGGPYGENLAWASPELSGIGAVNMWVNERANYNYASNTCNGVCGHYTQVVWRNSVRVGCGKTKCNNGGSLVVCNYDPPGNYVNQKPY
ncbi:unnamed protein product [Cochlearia groenlandica]